MYILGTELIFPPVQSAAKNGLLAVGGDLSSERLLLAYRLGIFPWYDVNDPICWYCPDPRFVLFPEELKITKSMRSVLNSGILTFTVNKAFTEVIKNCKNVIRKNRQGTWISDDIISAYTTLHTQGYAHSAEAWINGELVGGLYGIRLGNIFCGESMFSKQSNASKFAFISYIKYLQKQQVQLIDCQVYSDHLQSMGARLIDREIFLQQLSTLVE
jgi:leucyl/phenylalanyl-tRNA--protein transferase